MKQTCIKTQIHCQLEFTLLILVLSKKTLIFFVNTKLEHDKWRKHDTRGSMVPFSHLLSFAYGLYMTTATLLNGHLYNEGYTFSSHFMHTSANISTFRVKKRLF